MRRGAAVVSVLSVLFAVSFSSCGGGGGGSSVSPAYSGITTAAVITDNNADEIALAAFEGGDLGASTVVPFAPAGGAAARQPAAPAGLALVRTVSNVAAAAVVSPAATGSPPPKTPFTESGVIADGMGGEARYTISGDDQTGVFSGTFEFVNFHGDGGGAIDGAVAVSGTVTPSSMHILFDFRSVHVADPAGGSDVTVAGTVDLTVSMDQAPGADTATLNLFLTDSFTGKAVWLSDYHLTTVVGAGYSDVTLSGRIYLHDYGYVDVVTPAPFRYPDGATFPSSGQMTVTGQADRGVRLTADGPTQCTLDADLDGDGLYDELTATLSW